MDERKPTTKTLGDIFMALEAEIEATKSGELPLDVSRTINPKRAQQIKLAALQLQVARLAASANGRRLRNLNLTTGDSEVPTPAEPASPTPN